MEQGQQPSRNFDSNIRQSQAELAARYRARERRKLVGVLVIVLFILALAFFRFGRTIPWGSR